MTITHTIGFESSRTTVKTEVEVFHDNTVKFTRILDSRIKQYIHSRAESEKPITVSECALITKLDDEMFGLLSDTQEPQDDLEGLH